jgi:hypothetical protein
LEDKKPFKYRCRICGHEWASDSGVYQFCPNFVKGEECVTLCTAYDFPRHESVDVIKARPDNHNFEEKYRGDPLGWKRAGYVNRSADWNPKTKRYEWGGDPRKALTKKGRERPTRKDLNL